MSKRNLLNSTTALILQEVQKTQEPTNRADILPHRDGKEMEQFIFTLIVLGYLSCPGHFSCVAITEAGKEALQAWESNQGK